MSVRRVFQRWTHFRITGGSMRPSLEPGDRILVDRVAFQATAPQSGDVVVCLHPYVREQKLVKRIGERPADTRDEGHWLVGDDPRESTDSRSFGPVRDSRLVGKVAWRYWPLTRIGPVR